MTTDANGNGANGERALGHWIVSNIPIVWVLLATVVAMGAAWGVTTTKMAAADEALATYGKENRARIEACQKQIEAEREAATQWRLRQSEDMAAVRAALGIPRTRQSPGGL